MSPWKARTLNKGAFTFSAKNRLRRVGHDHQPDRARRPPDAGVILTGKIRPFNPSRKYEERRIKSKTETIAKALVAAEAAAKELADAFPAHGPAQSFAGALPQRAGTRRPRPTANPPVEKVEGPAIRSCVGDNAAP